MRWFEKLRSIFSRRGLRRLMITAWPFLAIVVLGTVALAHPNGAWTTAILSTAALLPLGLTVAARYGGEVRRPSRFGFAICCGGYFLFFTFFTDSPYLVNLFTSKAIDSCFQRFFPPSAFPQSGGFGGGGFGGGAGFGGASSQPALNPSPAGANLQPADPFSDAGKSGAQTSPPANMDEDPFGNTQASAAKPIAAQPAASAQISNAAKTQQFQDWLQWQEWSKNFVLIGHALCALLFGWIGACLAQFMANRQPQPNGHTNPTR
jgi:hypothetical protein